jgi:hypothetical protein
MEDPSMRRLLFGFVFAAGLLLGQVHPGVVLAQCPGTSGTATINSTAWTATCVVAANASDCVDSLGNTYQCFEILGTNGADPAYNSVALFFGQPLVQGQTYDLGGSSPNGAMVVGESAFCITAEAPYTGQATVNVYNSGSGAFDCTFHFEARSLFIGPDVTVTAGHFTGTVVAVQPATWTGFKAIYR